MGPIIFFHMLRKPLETCSKHCTYTSAVSNTVTSISLFGRVQSSWIRIGIEIQDVLILIGPNSENWEYLNYTASVIPSVRPSYHHPVYTPMKKIRNLRYHLRIGTHRATAYTGFTSKHTKGVI